MKQGSLARLRPAMTVAIRRVEILGKRSAGDGFFCREEIQFASCGGRRWSLLINQAFNERSGVQAAIYRVAGW